MARKKAKKSNDYSTYLMVGGIATALLVPGIGMVGLLPAATGAYMKYKDKIRKPKAKGKDKKKQGADDGRGVFNPEERGYEKHKSFGFKYPEGVKPEKPVRDLKWSMWGEYAKDRAQRGGQSSEPIVLKSSSATNRAASSSAGLSKRKSGLTSHGIQGKPKRKLLSVRPKKKDRSGLGRESSFPVREVESPIKKGELHIV